MTDVIHDEASVAAEVTRRFSTATSVAAADITGSAGGFSAKIFRVTVTYADAGDEDAQRPTSMIVKTTKEAATSKASGIAREADFYASLARVVDPACAFIPHCYFAAKDAATGIKIVALEDLATPDRQGVQSGYFFGPNSVINWGKDLAALTANFPQVGERAVALRATADAATLHAAFWMDPALLASSSSSDATGPSTASFLRASGWVQGLPADKAAFDSTSGWAVGAWKRTLERVQNEMDAAARAGGPAPTLTLDPRIVTFMETSIQALGYEAYKNMWQTNAGAGGIPWTLVHGDYHPANFIVTLPKKPAADAAGAHAEAFALFLVDWEAVGVGSGPQELGQYMISHSTAAARRAIEDELLGVYHQRLVAELARIAATKPAAGAAAAAPTAVTLDHVRREYVYGGLARWAWLMPVCFEVCPPAMSQYFHDQVLQFLVDHAVDPTAVPMLRP
jgi:hypothetical protein